MVLGAFDVQVSDAGKLAAIDRFSSAIVIELVRNLETARNSSLTVVRLRITGTSNVIILNFANFKKIFCLTAYGNPPIFNGVRS